MVKTFIFGILILLCFSLVGCGVIDNKSGDIEEAIRIAEEFVLRNSSLSQDGFGTLVAKVNINKDIEIFGEIFENNNEEWIPGKNLGIKEMLLLLKKEKQNFEVKECHYLNINEVEEYIKNNINSFTMEEADIMITTFELLQKREIANTYDNIPGVNIDYAAYNQFFEYIPPSLKEYLIIMALESENNPTKNKALIIDEVEILKRGIILEEYLKKYPESSRKEEIENLYNKYLRFIYYGLDNTPLFEGISGKMKDETKRSYLHMIRENYESNMIKDLAVFMDMIEKNNYVMDSTLDEYRKVITGIKRS